MGFKWVCECGQKNLYSGDKTKDANSTCSKCKKTQRIWKLRIIKIPTDSNKIQQNSNTFPTKYKTTITTPSKASAQINLDYWEDMANWAINTIKYKTVVLEENMGSQVYRNYLRWVKQRDIIIKLKEEVEK